MTTFLLLALLQRWQEEATRVPATRDEHEHREDTTLVTEVNVAGGAKGLIDRATAADGTEKASKSIFLRD